jgi:AraC-like DNA-binding protein
MLVQICLEPIERPATEWQTEPLRIAQGCGDDFCKEFLLARLDVDRAPHPAVLYAVKEFRATQGQRPVSEVTERLGLSPKRFIDLFREAVGLTPKLFCRIQRFQRVLHLIEREEDPIEWADIATACGYYDQAHLIHDFQTFSGFTPGAYLKQREQSDVTRSEAACRSALANLRQRRIHHNCVALPD